MQHKIALIVGRFQPFHNGHLFLLKKALEKAEKIVFAIGSASIYDKNNPISFEERKKIIKAVAYKEKIEDRLIKIVRLEDFFDDKKWLENLEKQVGKFDVALGNNEWPNKILGKAGYKVLKVDYYKKSLCEGWRIRKLIKEGNRWQNRVPNYLIKAITDYACLPARQGLRITKFNHVVLGGTFDHFHAGHKALLEKAFEVGKKITIGIATEELYKDKFLSETVEPFNVRRKNIRDYVNDHLNNDRAKMVKIMPFSEFTGGVDKIKNIDAIVVAKETYLNALKINQLREKNKLPLLRIIIIKDILAEDGKLINSERIRAGEIDRDGHVYNLSSINDQLLMPESLRPTLQKPLGKVYKSVGAIFKSPKKPIMLIGVGDIIVDSLLKEGIDPGVKVIDFRSHRRVIPAEAGIHINIPPRNSKMINNPGTINIATAEKLKQMIRSNTNHPKGVQPQSWLVIDGEEDLLTLPAILFAPLHSLILYGHWQLGIVVVKVTEEKKKETLNLLNKFK